MGNCSPKCKIIIGHSILFSVFVIGSTIYLLADFVGVFDKIPPVTDENCKTFDLRGPEDITALSADTAFIGSDDRQNWLIQENINQTGVENGKITKLSGVNRAVSSDGFAGISADEIHLSDAGFPEGVAFHPHGMSITPDWVSTTDKQLMVINHAWLEGGERIEIFEIDQDDDNKLTWKYAIGAQPATAEGEDVDYTGSPWQVLSYGAYNGLTIVGKDEVLLGDWLQSTYPVPGSPDYSDDTAKDIGPGDQSGIMWAKYSETELDNTPEGAEFEEQANGYTYWKQSIQGFQCAKSVTSNEDGSQYYIIDTIARSIGMYTFDVDTKTLTQAEDTETLETQGRIDNLKTTPGTGSFVGGTMTSLTGNVAFELQRKEETWDTPPTNNVDSYGGAEEFRMNEDGELQSRIIVHTNKINGFSDGTKVGNNVIIGSWIDPNYLVCPYNDDIEWKTLEAPKGPTGYFVFMFVFLGLQITGACYQWRKASKDGDDYS